ncbi:ATP-binding protein [Pseudomonas yamanorum]|uniref:ATP-binding protein n=1 Tax=Pseudomonas yamanorum TaxID=515393 RepID=UPI002ED00702|nr:transporter substrate-binding domain-containing protein [Pseudomonas yamanorum]
MSQSLSASEQYWLKQHPRLRVAVNHNFMPISFVDGQGKFKGIGADVLATVSQRTGLQFDFVYAETSRDLVGLLERGDVDLLATVTKSAEREAVLKFTRPYISEPIVLVTPFANKTAFSLNDMNGLKVAVTRGTIQSEILRTRYPAITAVEVPSVNDALNMTVQGEVDGALGAMMSTRYKVIAGYSGSLQIAGAVEDALAETAIATQPDAVELNSILSKALLSIAPEEMDALTSHWRGPLLIADSFWGRYQKTLTRSLVIGVLLLLIVLIWAGYLMRLIRQRSRAELALNEQMEFMRVLIDGTPHPIYVRDREGRLLICNSGYLKAFNVEREAVLGRRVTEGQLLTPEAAHACQEMYIRVMAQGVAQIQDHTLTLGSGVSLTAYHWVFPYQNIAGDTVGIICGWIDVSERQQLFKQLEAALEGAEVANRAKTTFLSVMSHEIRTPLNAVIGMLDLMLRKNSDERIDRHSLAVAAGAASELQMLVGDILDVARIESGHLSLTPERAGLRALVESVVRVFEGGAREKGLALILDFAPEADREVLVDPLRFKQVVSNLLSNAIKFTFNGEVLLTVSVLPSGDSEELKVCLRIKDSGIGISKDDQLQLFTPFTQASNNNQSARSGSGLGLVISRTLCEMMQGQLELASSLGRGTQVTMIVSLPLLAAVEHTEEFGAGAPVFAEKALSILIVDDYPANRLLLTQQLNYLGHQVVDAEDGVEGLHQWRKGGFDVVITDINMPFMQGMELSRIIRKEELAAGVEPCLILGFTANARADERLRCIEAGMDDCMFKPISLGDLSSRLGGAVETPPAAEPVTPTASYEIDLSGIEQMARGDKASIDNLLDKLLASNRTDAEDLEHLLNAQDIRGISLLAHRVKGGAKMIRMASLVLACEQVENACEAAEPKAVKRTVETLQAAMLRLTEQLMIHR